MLIATFGTTYYGPGIISFRPGPFQIAESGPFSMGPVAMEYKDTNDACIGSDNFVEHFLKCFGKWRTYVTISIGPELHPATCQENHAKAVAWLAEETQRIRNGYRLGVKPKPALSAL